MSLRIRLGRTSMSKPAIAFALAVALSIAGPAVAALV
jgi:hypothetical protein